MSATWPPPWDHTEPVAPFTYKRRTCPTCKNRYRPPNDKDGVSYMQSHCNDCHTIRLAR